jgi:hypothetical protein
LKLRYIYFILFISYFIYYLQQLRLLQEEVDVARLQLDEDVPPNPQVQVLQAHYILLNELA